MTSSNSKKVSVNALFLYLRTAVSMILQLLAVRYLLKYLGEDGYGLYGLIGSIVAIVSNLMGLLASSVQRFLNIAIGRKDDKAVKEIFNSAVVIHLFISILLILITLALGTAAMPHLDIPGDLQTQAWWVLLFSALTMGVDILAVPYTAMLMAYERFNAYAALTILDSVLKLVIVLLLIFFPVSRVAIYAGMLLGVAITVRLLYWGVCRKSFRRLVKIERKIDRQYLRSLTEFAGFKGIGIVSNTLQSTGINFILNIVAGLVANTARTISYQILSAVNVLVWNVNYAFLPRIMTLYGERNIPEYTKMVEQMSKFTFLINLIMAFTLSVLIYPILNLWLGEIPEYTPVFIVLIFLYAISRSFIDSIDAVFSAEGKVKGIQVVLTIGMVLILALAWFFLKAGYSIYWGFGWMAIIEALQCAAGYILASKTTSFDIRRLVTKVLLPAFFLTAAFAAIGAMLQHIIPRHLNFFLLICIFTGLILFSGISSAKILLSKNEFASLMQMGKSVFLKFKHSNNPHR